MRKSPGDRDPHPLAPELIALLHLRALPGIGDVRGRSLLDRFGSASAVLRAPAKALGDAAARARDRALTTGRVDRAIDTIGRLGIVPIPYDDARYPARLNELHDAPLLLFAAGDLDLLVRPGLAVVGTRRATTHGLDATHTLVPAVARTGTPVISGLARGIDTAAHRAALDAGGPTIAVLGAGIDVPYPRENSALHEEIGVRGLLLSEFLPGTPPARGHFVRRNRIIAALARAVLVVEAPQRSGALTTVGHALDLNRDVLAVPGPIGRPSCVGTNELLRDGAALVLEPLDLLDALGGRTPPSAGDGASQRGAAGGMRARRERRRAEAAGRPAPADPAANALWKALDEESQHVDVLASRAGITAASAAAALLQLELEGRVQHAGGMSFRRIG